MVDKIWYNMEELIGGSEERVLIETYWNVKINAYNLIWNEWCINRNILECKDRCVYLYHSDGWRINRNILECKDCSK